MFFFYFVGINMQDNDECAGVRMGDNYAQPLTTGKWL